MTAKNQVIRSVFKSTRVLQCIQVLLERELVKESQNLGISLDSFTTEQVTKVRHRLAYKLGHRNFNNMVTRLRDIPPENMDLLLRGDKELNEHHLNREVLDVYYRPYAMERSKMKNLEQKLKGRE